MTDGYLKKIGMICVSMMRSNRYHRYPVAYISAKIESAVFLRQIKFFFDQNGRVMGYVVWAFLDAETEHKVIDNPLYALPLSDWNEGNKLWIMDFVVNDGDVRRRLRETREVLAMYDVAWSIRIRKDGSKKISRWKL